MTAPSEKRTFDLVKRTADIAIASVLLVATLPVQAVVAGMILRKFGRPVLFRQERPGLHGEIFELVKFRSMLNEDVSKGLVSDDKRLTNFGRFLRSTSLDELPTLWNVVKGDMSLVGPRPLLVRYLERYSPHQNKRHDVRPGITGLAQVRGRNLLSWDEKFALDVAYVQERSIALDIRILIETVKSVLSRQGITAVGSATMPEFNGDAHGVDSEKQCND